MVRKVDLEMNVKSITFLDRPVFHILPDIYENLGLPDLSSFYEQHFTFILTFGKIDTKGNGRIRYYKKEKIYKVHLLEHLPGVGPVRQKKLKQLLLQQTISTFKNNIETEQNMRKVYYADFGRR
ncbi:hypothetical protein [Peribacillus sp. SCS-155]|uniref:hypothetical protein n=1 Tax=Peribacillus sedimenti TaxID=3115297 RepID=UPI0039058C0A